MDIEERSKERQARSLIQNKACRRSEGPERRVGGGQGPSSPANGTVRMRALSAVNDVILQIYDAAADPELWPDVLEGLRLSLNAAGSAVVEYDFADQHCRVLASAGTRPDFIRCYEEGLAHQIPWIRDGPWYAPGRVSHGHEIVADEELARSEVYEVWLKPNGLFHRLCGVIRRRGSRALFLVASRPPASGRYAEVEAGFVAALLPHLRRALRLNCKLVGSQTVSTAFELLPHGMFIVDRTGRPVLMNRAAADLLSQGALLLDRHDRLATVDAGATAQLRRTLSRLVAHEAGAAREIVTPRSTGDGRQPLPLCVIPMGLRSRDMVTGEGRVLVLAMPQHTARQQEGRLRKLYGLTAAEERLALLILQGRRLDEAEAVLGIRHSTARTHMKRIYAKTGTRRQAELVGLIMAGQSPLDDRNAGDEEVR